MLVLWLMELDAGGFFDIAVGGFVWVGVEDWSGGLEMEYGAMGLWG